jgi:hypothetical protein
MNFKNVSLALISLCATSRIALAQGVPNDCLASFSVKDQKLSSNLNWILATGANATMSCAAGELLRERLFIEGASKLSETDLSGTPASAQQKALAAFDDMEKRIQQLPGADAPGTLFSAGAYLFSKYQFASCILTSEAEGGTCWISAAKFLASTSKFFQKLYKNESDSLRKQELLTNLQNLRPAIVSVQPGQADSKSARIRWINTQTQLCRAIQMQCF